MSGISSLDVPQPDLASSFASANRFIARMLFKGPLPGAAGRRLAVYRIYASFLKHGRPVHQIIAAHWSFASHDGLKPTRSEAIMASHWLADYKRHGDLGRAIRDWIPQNEAVMLAAAEAAGHLKTGLDNAAMMLIGLRDMRQALIGSLAYPFLILLAVFAALYGMGTEVLPVFDQVYPMAKWTGGAASLAQMAYFSQHLLVPTMAALLLLIGVIVWTLPRWTGSLRRFADRLPPWNLYRQASGTSFMLSMAALVSAGISQHEALAKIANHSSPYLERHAQNMLREMLQGASSFGEAMYRTGANWPDEHIVLYMRAFGAAPDFSQLIVEIAKEWLQTSIASVRAKAALIRNGMFLLLGALVAQIVIGMTALQQQLGDSLQQSL